MRARRAAGHRVRELMAEARVGRWRTVRPQVISARALFVKVRKGGRGLAPAFTPSRDGELQYAPVCRLLLSWFGRMSAFEPDGSHFVGGHAQKRPTYCPNLSSHILVSVEHQKRKRSPTRLLCSRGDILRESLVACHISCFSTRCYCNCKDKVIMISSKRLNEDVFFSL